ncbi:class I lanthipeptide [Chitinophaga sp. Hz27]|uniref:class I lanthipeptide n=1 Tax=Chitinophaga sp. Hz27 TaxID=3347169 RepID=UPI0035E15B68
MKKKIALQNSKLPFDKERIANLTPDELDQVEGGVQSPIVSGDQTTHHNFTCGASNTMSAYLDA